MTVTLGVLPIVAGVPTSKEVADYKGLLIGNESGLTVTITMDGTNDSKSLYPGTVDYFPLRKSFSGTVKITNSAMLNNVASWPSSFLQFDALGPNDDVNIS